MKLTRTEGSAGGGDPEEEWGLAGGDLYLAWREDSKGDANPAEKWSLAGGEKEGPERGILGLGSTLGKHLGCEPDSATRSK